MSHDEPPKFSIGTEEYVSAIVTATPYEGDDPIVLDEQAVQLSIDNGTTWLPASWQGEPGPRRRAMTDDLVTIEGPERAMTVAVDLVVGTEHVKLTAEGYVDVVSL